MAANAGRILLISRGDYNPATEYKILDIVRDGGKTWVCKQTCTGQTPAENTYWFLITQDGADGTIGSIIYKGTGITGDSTTPTIFSGSGIADAHVYDIYINESTGNMYQCTTGGIATVAEWVYFFSLGGVVNWPDILNKPFSSFGTDGIIVTEGVADVDLLKIERKASTLTSKATVVLTDEMVITDSADTSITKRSPFSALKTLFQNHFVTLDTQQTISLPKAFAQGLIAYGKTLTALPTLIGAYITMYVDPTYGPRLLSYDGTNYQPLSIGALVSAGKFSMKLLADGNLEINGITIFVPRATAPSTPTEGMVYYDSVAKVLKTYNGTSWVSGGGSGTVINDGDSNPIATTTLIDTLTGIVSNTTANQAAGALALKTLEARFTYSTTEAVVGTWIDGKPLYQKTIACGALPNNTSKNVAHGISNIGYVVSWDGGTVNPSTSDRAPLPIVSTATNTSLNVNPTNIIITTAADRSAFTLSWVTIRYTKTTD